jgi:hypothetical protein
LEDFRGSPELSDPAYPAPQEGKEDAPGQEGFNAYYMENYQMLGQYSGWYVWAPHSSTDKFRVFRAQLTRLAIRPDF